MRQRETGAGSGWPPKEGKMSDISMCDGRNCPLEKYECYRFTAPQSEYWQAWFGEPPHKDGDCEYFWDNAGFYWDIMHQAEMKRR